MNLSNLQPVEGSTHNQNKRLGRGEGSGGGTLQEVTKEQKSRSGYSKIGFEGGKCHFKDVAQVWFYKHQSKTTRV
jgi:large subunit ribosomal protein L15